MAFDEARKEADQPPQSGPFSFLVPCRSPVHREDALRHRWSVSKGAVRPDRVVVFPPFFDHDLRLF